MKWINIKGERPNFNEPVLVCDESDENSVNICRLDSYTETQNSSSHVFYEGKSGYDTWYKPVTHWALLPNTPQTKPTK